jgi:dihydrofolate reductase
MHNSPFEKVIEAEYDLLLGKRTYDIFSTYWPYNQDNPIGEKFQRINKYVLTHSDEPLSWENSHKLSGDTAEAVAALKRSDGRNLLIQGSSTLYAPLLAAGLIDQLVLMTFPVVLGDGKRIFDGSQEPGALKLVDHFVSNKGVVFATYEPAGEVQTGSFATKEPSEAELERREKWAKEDA